MPAFELINEQDEVSFDESAVNAFINTPALADIPEFNARTAVIALIDDAEMARLNLTFRGKDATTDVLSFPHEPDAFDDDDAYLGDIAISAAQAKKQADENGLTLENELMQLILHGLLHLAGFDHETDDGEMNTRELELRAALGID